MALLSLPREVRNELRFESVFLARVVVLRRTDAGNLAIREFQDAGLIAWVRITTREYFHSISPDEEPAPCVVNRCAVAALRNSVTTSGSVTASPTAVVRGAAKTSIASEKGADCEFLLDKVGEFHVIEEESENAQRESAK